MLFNIWLALTLGWIIATLTGIRNELAFIRKHREK